MSKVTEIADVEEDEELGEFWWVEFNPTQQCFGCGETMPWSYYTTKCKKCSDAYWRSVYEWEHRK